MSCDDAWSWCMIWNVRFGLMQRLYDMIRYNDVAWHDWSSRSDQAVLCFVVHHSESKEHIDGSDHTNHYPGYVTRQIWKFQILWASKHLWAVEVDNHRPKCWGFKSADFCIKGLAVKSGGQDVKKYVPSNLQGPPRCLAWWLCSGTWITWACLARSTMCTLTHQPPSRP